MLSTPLPRHLGPDPGRPSAGTTAGALELPPKGPKVMADLHAEARVMCHLRHPNIGEPASSACACTVLTAAACCPSASSMPAEPPPPCTLHAVSFIGVCTMPPCLVTEYCSRGSLYDVLHSAAHDASLAAQLTWPLRLHMVRSWGRRAPPPPASGPLA